MYSLWLCTRQDILLNKKEDYTTIVIKTVIQFFGNIAKKIIVKFNKPQATGFGFTTNTILNHNKASETISDAIKADNSIGKKP